MRVAYVTSLFPVGSETFASNDVRELDTRGVDMRVYSLRPAGRDTHDLVAQRGLGGVGRSYNCGIRTVARGLRLAFKRPMVAADLLCALLTQCLRSPEQLLKSLILFPRVLEVFDDIERHRPDVVHAFWSNYPAMVVYLVQRHLPDAVTSISFVAHDILLRYGLSGPVARRADFVRTLGRVNVPQVVAGFDVPADRIEIVVDGVDLTLVPPPVERIPRSIVTAGRLVDKKGMDLVLRAFARVRERWPDAVLRVLGSGPLLGKLRALADDLGVTSSVTFVGHVTQRQVLDEMRRAEVFAFLSETDYDRLPNVVKEAMVCGCVCVASDTDGIDELIDAGRTGFIVAKSDFDAAARHIDDVFAGRLDAAAMGAAAEAYIRRAFDLRASARQYERRWSELVANRRGR